jgi:phospholipase C
VTIVEWVCVAWFWVLEAVCTVWSWVAKLVCIAWDNARCALVRIVRGLGTLIFGGRRDRRRIRHVFVLMLENRSFDHMLGFSDIRGTDPQDQPTAIDNLIGNPQQNIDPATGNPVSASAPADFALTASDGDPGHELHDTLEQLAGTGAVYPTGGTPSYPPINNSGYIANLRARGSAAPEKAMHVYAPDQLPILNALAREFAVCDRWFSSIPGPTWPNRLFVHAASSAGLDDSPGDWDTVTTTLIDGYRFDNGSIYDRLEDKCLDWLVFEGDETPQVFSLSGMTYNALQGRFRDFEDFRDSVNDRNFPASYSFIEPHYGNIMPWTPGDFTCGNSQHPLDDVTRGERLIKDVYEAVRNSPHWETSLIIVTYDEHGGFFDHAVPPGTVHPGDSITDNENNHNDFDFTQLGARVPTVVISPWIPRNTIDHQVYDHSSVIKTASQLLGFGTLTNRDGTANSLTHLLSLGAPRTDTPATLPPVAESGLRCTSDAPDAATGSAPAGLVDRGEFEEINRKAEQRRKELQARPIEPAIRGFVQVALRRYLSVAPIAKRDEIVERFLRLDNSYDARLFIKEATDVIRAYKLLHEPRKPWKHGQRPEGGGRPGADRTSATH